MKLWLAMSALVLALVCGANLAGVLRRVPPPPHAPVSPPANVVLRHEQRMAAVRQKLHEHGVRGPVGYLADLAPDKIAADHRAMEEYFLTQFALAPWVLDARAENPRWTVANLQATDPQARVPAGYRIAADCGGGVLLLERSAR